MKQPFKTSDLKAELESALGFSLRSLSRLDGASALNFKAVREPDGLAFAVKCLPVERHGIFEHLVRHLDETKGTKAVFRLFAEECPRTFRSYNVICLSWCDGERLFPDQLTPEQFADFLKEYLTFSAAMQKSTRVLPADPIADWRTEALAACCGFRGRWLHRLIERELPADVVAYRQDRLGVIHGDFHHGNFLFVDGRLTGFFDLEEFCEGYPADDIVRYIVCAAEHLKWYEQWRKREILKRFSEAVGQLPYPEDEWQTAIGGLLIRKIIKKIGGRRLGLFQMLNLLFRARFYLALKCVVRLSRHRRGVGSRRF